MNSSNDQTFKNVLKESNFAHRSPDKFHLKSLPIASHEADPQATPNRKSLDKDPIYLDVPECEKEDSYVSTSAVSSDSTSVVNIGVDVNSNYGDGYVRGKSLYNWDRGLVSRCFKKFHSFRCQSSK